MNPFSRPDPNILLILKQLVILNNQMSQLQDVAASLSKNVTSIEVRISNLETIAANTEANLKGWLSNPPADPAALAQLSDAESRLSAIGPRLDTLTSNLQAADPGPVPVSPVNG